MRLSIQMIADRLAGYSPEAQITSGGRKLLNARLLSESHVRSRSTLYLQQNTPETVVCTNDNDILLLHADDIEDVLNSILDVFDRFNEWDAQIDDIIRDGYPIKDVLDAIAQEGDMHLILADATYLIHETAVGATRLDVPMIDEYIQNRSMPIDLILRIDSDAKVRSADAGVYYVVIDESHRSAVCNIFVNGMHQGWLVANRPGNAFTPGDFDFLEAAKGKLEQWMLANWEGDDRWAQTAIFAQLAEGTVRDESLVRRALAVLGWHEGDTLRAYALLPAILSRNSLHVVERFLAQAVAPSFAVRMPESLMAVVNETLADAPSSHREIARVCETCGYHVGASPVFSDIMELPSHYGAAMVAARSADTPGEIVDFDDIKLPYALSVLRLDSVADVRHSALAQLAAYDAAHGTELLETLRCYVENRGSYVRTYERLFIHRSTLQYRLERIAELCGIDFSDPDVWLHLQLSFALDG